MSFDEIFDLTAGVYFHFYNNIHTIILTYSREWLRTSLKKHVRRFVWRSVAYVANNRPIWDLYRYFQNSTKGYYTYDRREQRGLLARVIPSYCTARKGSKKHQQNNTHQLIINPLDLPPCIALDSCY